MNIKPTKRLYLLLLFFSILNTYSQISTNVNRIDSLLRVFKSEKNAVSKINICNLLCEAYRKKSLDTLIFYNDHLVELSKKNDYERGIGLYHYHLIHINEDLGKDRVETAKKAASIFLKVKDTVYFLKTQYYLANAFMNISKYEDGKEIINTSLRIAIKQNLNTETGSFFRLLGLINYYEGKLDNSLNLYKKALFYYDKDSSNNKNKSELYLYMAFIYTDLGELDKSIEYLDLANTNEENVDVNIEKAVVLNKMGKHKKAIRILLNNRNPSIYKPKNINDYNTYILADTYYQLHQYNQAIKNLKLISEGNPFFEFNIEYYNLLANCYIKINQLEKAKFNNDKALSLLDSSNVSKTKQAVFLTKSKIEIKNKNFEQALYFHKKQASLKEAYDAKINEDKVRELQVDFEVTEKDNKIKSLQISQLKKDIKISKQKDYIFIITFSLVVTCILIFTFIKININSKRKNNIIAKNNIDLEDSIKEKEILLKEIHHRVKNNLQLVMSLLYIQSKQKGSNMDDFLDISQTRIVSMALIHENLYQTNNLSKVNFNEYVESLKKSILASNKNPTQNIQLQTKIGKVYFDIQTAIPLGLIINELINNAYKHAFKERKKGIIELNLQHLNDTDYQLEINDNGIGFFNNQTSKTTLGLELVKQLVIQIKGTLDVKNNLGTQYKIQFKNLTLS